MRQRSFPLRALHKHRNRHPDTLIDVDHDNFFLIAKKNRDAAACRRHCADLYFDNRLAHVASLGSHVASGYRIRRPGQNRGTLVVGDGRQEVWATVLCSASSLCTIASGGSIGRERRNGATGSSDRFLDGAVGPLRGRQITPACYALLCSAVARDKSTKPIRSSQDRIP